MTKKMMRLAVLLGLVTPLLYGCGDSTLSFVPALRIEIRDARTGAPAAYGATVIVRDGAFMEVHHINAEVSPEYQDSAAMIFAGPHHAGTYEVTITHPRYATWSRSDIRVRWSNEREVFSGSRTPEQVHVLAELEPLDER